MQPVTPSSTDVTVHIRIIDSAAGTPETGVTSASAGLALSYRKGATAALTAITESDLAALTTAHTDGGMKHVDAGLYRIDLPDAAVPTAEGEVTWVGGVVTDMIVIPAAIVGRVVPLAPTTAGRALDVSAGGEAGIDWANIGSPTTAVNLSATNIDVDQVVASVSGAVGSVTGAVGSVTGAVGSVAAGGITAASIADNAIDTATFAAGTTIPRVTLADTLTTYTGNTPQTGDAFAYLGTNVGANGANLTAADDAVLAALVTIASYIDTEVAAIKLKTDLIPASPAAVGSAMTLATDAINAAAVAAAGAAKLADIIVRRTVANIEASLNGDTLDKDSLYGLMMQAFESSISGTTLTVRKSDATTLGTRTLTTNASADPITGIT